MKKQTEINLNYVKAEIIEFSGNIKQTISNGLSKACNFLNKSSEKDLDKSHELYDQVNQMVKDETDQKIEQEEG